MRVGLFVPCFVDALVPQVAVATVHVLEHLGVQVDYPAEQTCCGQPYFNAGHRSEARRLARRFCQIFSRFEAVVSPSGSCVSMVRNHYRALGEEDAICHRTFELCEFLVRVLGVTELGASLPARAVMHVGCHALRELRIEEPVAQLLDNVSGLHMVTVPSQHWCCGFGGTFAVKYPEISGAMTRRKLQPVLDAGVDYVISTDSSCGLQLSGVLEKQQLRTPRVLHVAEVLASSAGGS